MGQNTSRLGLYLPGGGSTGLITPDEPADIDKINDNMTKLDADAGAYVCTSSTRPATPYNGKIIFETDTRKTLIYKSATTSWEPVDSQGKIVANAAARDALFASPVQGTKVFRNDIGVTETYYAAFNASTNPGGRTPAGWYKSDTNDGLVNVVPTSVAQAGGSASANAQGLVTFTGVTSLSLNGVFTNTYTNYRMVINTPSASYSSGSVRMRMRASGADITTSVYHQMQFISRITGSTQTNSGSAINAGGLYGTSAESNSRFGWTGDIWNPAQTSQTSISGLGMSNDSTGAFQTIGAVFVSTTAAYDGITIFPDSGTITGTIQIFAYNN